MQRKLENHVRAALLVCLALLGSQLAFPHLLLASHLPDLGLACDPVPEDPGTCGDGEPDLGPLSSFEPILITDRATNSTGLRDAGAEVRALSSLVPLAGFQPSAP